MMYNMDDTSTNIQEYFLNGIVSLGGGKCGKTEVKNWFFIFFCIENIKKPFFLDDFMLVSFRKVFPIIISS